jgi:predicted neuraminidase
MAEPCAAELSDGRLLMLARTGAGSLHRSFSSDAGDSWSVPEPTSLASACSSLTLKTMPDGRLIVLYNHAAPIAPGAFFPRTPLVYAISADEGRSWSDPVIIDDEGMEKKDRQCIYPSIAFSSEGMVVAYSVHAADPGGSFKNGGDDGWKIGGGKICIIPY